MLSKDSKIYIAGHHGLVGSAIWNNLKKRGYNNLVGRSHKELDLTDQYAVQKFLTRSAPTQSYWLLPSWVASWPTRSIVLTSSCRT